MKCLRLLPCLLVLLCLCGCGAEQEVIYFRMDGQLWGANEGGAWFIAEDVGRDLAQWDGKAYFHRDNEVFCYDGASVYTLAAVPDDFIAVGRFFPGDFNWLATEDGLIMERYDGTAWQTVCLGYEGTLLAGTYEVQRAPIDRSWIPNDDERNLSGMFLHQDRLFYYENNLLYMCTSDGTEVLLHEFPKVGYDGYGVDYIGFFPPLYFGETALIAVDAYSEADTVAIYIPYPVTP